MHALVHLHEQKTLLNEKYARIAEASLAPFSVGRCTHVRASAQTGTQPHEHADNTTKRIDVMLSPPDQVLQPATTLPLVKPCVPIYLKGRVECQRDVHTF